MLFFQMAHSRTKCEGTCQNNCKEIVQYQAEVSDVKETVCTGNFALYCTLPDIGNVTFFT